MAQTIADILARFRGTAPSLDGANAAPPPSPRHDNIDLGALPHGATFLRILGVNYVHLKTDDDGDLYLTEHGVPFLDHLRPENWYEHEWFEHHRERLEGSGTVYRVPTRPIVDTRDDARGGGARQPRRRRSIDLVVKWSRMGQDVPLNTYTLKRVIDAVFNSPFEEFSLVEELRAALHGPAGLRIPAQRPLAIYVPPEHLQLWQTGRTRDRLATTIARHQGVEIDILRSYIMLYAWIKGPNAVDAYRRLPLDEDQRRARLAELTRAGEEELAAKGFTVADHKPVHFIVRTRRDGQIRRRHDGRVAYALVDYELLARTPEHEEAVKRALRRRYLLMERDRFNPPRDIDWPQHLFPAEVHGVPYVYGVADSTGGRLWVVGKDPELFNYFLPERWRERQVRLSDSNRTFYAQTKDRIHLVWKVSRVGDIPAGDLGSPAYRPMLLHGYNTPFEKVALALEMARRGLRVVYPRAIYVTSHRSDMTGTVVDTRRFDRYRALTAPDGLPVLRMEPDYISIWGYWRGLSDDVAPEEQGYWTPIDARRAHGSGVITTVELDELLARHRADLARAGFEDLNLKPDHMLLSHIPGGRIKRDAAGQIELRHCNLELVRQLSAPGGSGGEGGTAPERA